MVRVNVSRTPLSFCAIVIAKTMFLKSWLVGLTDLTIFGDEDTWREGISARARRDSLVNRYRRSRNLVNSAPLRQILSIGMLRISLFFEFFGVTMTVLF